MEFLQCMVERITYKNEQNGYSVLRCKAKGSKDPVTVVGNVADVYAGSILKVRGEWKINPKYGQQFCVATYEEVLPATANGIEKYLGSGLIKGIGPKYAGRIVRAFGKDTLDVIEHHPEKLSGIPGIGKKRIGLIKKSWQEQKEIKDIMVFLQGHEVSSAHAIKIYKTYGNKSLAVVKENPYKLADDIWGIGFKTADSIAKNLGVRHDAYIRLRSGLLYTLNALSDNGHCFARREQLIQKGMEILNVEREPLQDALDRMIANKDVVLDGDAIYLPAFYRSECGCAKKICTLLSKPRKKTIDVDRAIAKIQANKKIQYDEIQQEAIRVALSSKVMVLTGGPGTGKTTTTMGIISAYKSAGCEVILAAPTGRAAKRMSEATGMESKTIHRLLEYNPQKGYVKNAENPLEGDVLILDECSMIDIMLMYNLIKAIPPAMTLIIVGDTDQLPSVGAGNVLNDIITSGTVPVVRLQRIFRQAQGSRIITNAHNINQGKPIDMSNAKGTDFFFTAESSPESALREIVELCAKRLPDYYHADPVKDIQVLTPMQRGVIGAVNLNNELQKTLNPETVCLKRGAIEYRLRDKVMQIRNNYDKEVFNGDIGIICDVNTDDRELSVNFDGRIIKYDITELDELVLAYATTIHKAQGSEYPIVVMPFMMTHYVMLQRNLLYTGVTRAKKICVLVGEKKAAAFAIRNVKTTERNTRLAERLRSVKNL